MSETEAVAQSTTPPSKKRKISLAGTESSSPTKTSEQNSSEILKETNGCNNGNQAIHESGLSLNLFAVVSERIYYNCYTNIKITQVYSGKIM